MAPNDFSCAASPLRNYPLALTRPCPLPGDIRTYRGLRVYDLRACETEPDSFVRLYLGSFIRAPCITYYTVYVHYAATGTGRQRRGGRARQPSAAGQLQARNRVNFGRGRLQYITRCNMTAVQLARHYCHSASRTTSVPPRAKYTLRPLLCIVLYGENVRSACFSRIMFKYNTFIFIFIHHEW